MSMTVNVATAGAVFERQDHTSYSHRVAFKDALHGSFHAEPVRIRQQTALL